MELLNSVKDKRVCLDDCIRTQLACLKACQEISNQLQDVIQKQQTQLNKLTVTDNTPKYSE